MDNGELEHLYMRIDPNPSKGLGLGGKMFRLFGRKGLSWTVDGVLSKADGIMKSMLLGSVIGILIVILMGLIIPQVVYL